MATSKPGNTIHFITTEATETILGRSVLCLDFYQVQALAAYQIIWLAVMATDMTLKLLIKKKLNDTVSKLDGTIWIKLNYNPRNIEQVYMYVAGTLSELKAGKDSSWNQD